MKAHRLNSSNGTYKAIEFSMLTYVVPITFGFIKALKISNHQLVTYIFVLFVGVDE